MVLNQKILNKIKFFYWENKNKNKNKKNIFKKQKEVKIKKILNTKVVWNKK
jgi:hypothetical protein